MCSWEPFVCCGCNKIEGESVLLETDKAYDDII